MEDIIETMNPLQGKQITVVVPTCHRNDLLAKCLDCLAPASQTLLSSYYDVIVTDDGVSSTAQALVTERYPWAKWTQGPRRGPAANRNHGASLATTEWIAFTDDDCLPGRDWLTEFDKALETGFSVYEGQTICAAGLNSPTVEAPINETGGNLWSCNLFISRTVFLEMSGFDESFPFPASEDVDFRERLKQRGYSFPFVTNAVVDHPPRPMPKPRKQLGLDESIYYLQTRWGNPPGLGRLLYGKARYLGKIILTRQKSLESLVALWYLCSELMLMTLAYPKWKRKYKRFLASAVGQA